MPTFNGSNLAGNRYLVQKGYIDGQWVGSVSGRTFDVKNPSTNEVIATVPEMDERDTKNAIDTAYDTFKSWKMITPRGRSKYLREFYNRCLDHQESLASLITAENGKPLAEAKGEVAYGSSFLEWFAEEAPRDYGDNIMTENVNHRVVTMKQAVGVCGIITPFNFPIAMITRKVGAALAAGCTVVIKPDASTPLTCLAFAKLAEESGIPKGVINVVTGSDTGPAIGFELTTNPKVRKVSFTGSTRVGKLLMQQSAGTMKNVSMELGGNAPFIVFDDADLGEAVAGAIACKFRGSGQTCVCANRFYVQSGIHDKFSEALVQKVEQLKLGDGFEEGVTQGPLIHDRAVAKVRSHVQNAIDGGASVKTGGKLGPRGGNFFEPTVITGMSNKMAMAHEETFGPIAGIWKFGSEAEVIASANETEVGLAGYLFTQDIKRAWRMQEALEVGMVGVNTGLMSSAASPFGGVKESGLGREGSKYGLEEFTVIKSMTLSVN